MKISLFTSNLNRHNYLINLLSEVSDELFVIQECDTIFTGIMPGHYMATPIMKKYFEINSDMEPLKVTKTLMEYIDEAKKTLHVLD